MYQKRSKALSSFGSAHILNRLTLDEVKKVFPEKMKHILSPREKAITSRDQFFQQLKQQTVDENQRKLLDKPKRQAPAKMFAQQPVKTQLLIKHKPSQRDTFQEQIDKNRYNLHQAERYAILLKRKLRSNQLTNKSEQPNRIRMPQFEEQPDERIIEGLVDQENYREGMRPKPKYQVDEKSSFSNSLSMLPIHLVRSNTRERTSAHFATSRKGDLQNRISQALQELQQESKRLELRVSNALQSWKKTRTLTDKDNHERAKILYLARWNASYLVSYRSLKKILERHNLQNHEKLLLQRYYNQPVLELVLKVFEDKRSIASKFKESKQLMQSVPIVALSASPNKFSATQR